MISSIQKAVGTRLDQLGRKTHTDMRYFALGGFWLTLGSGLGSISSFVLAILFANLLTPETYGTYKYILSVASVLAITLLPGIDIALQRAVARGHEGSLMPTLKLKLRLGLLGSLGALAGAGYYFFQGNEVLGFSFVVVAFFLPLMDSVFIYDDLLRGRKQFAKATAYSAIAQIVSTIAIATAVLIAPTPPWVLLGYFGGWTIARSAVLFYVLKKSPPNTTHDDTTAGYGFHLSLMKGFATAAGSLGSILLFQTIGGSALAIFTFALAPIEQLRGWINSSESLFLAKFSEDTWKMQSLWWFMRKTAFFFIALSAGIAAYCVAAPFLYALVFPQYLESVIYSQVYAPSLILSALSVLFASVLKAKQEIKKLYIVNGTTIAISFICTAPFTYFWGIWGLLIATYLLKISEVAAMSYLLFKRSRS